MLNPWNDIDLNDYENHMKLDSVMQLQAMNEIMFDQFYHYPIEIIMILGIAGGNGLEHIIPGMISKVYGVDVNRAYLTECVKRYPMLNDTFVPVQADLSNEDIILPEADIIISNLLIEYIGYQDFQKVIQKVNPNYVSCVIQVNVDNSFVSDSSYLHAFDRLDEVHHQISNNELTQAMKDIGYHGVYTEEKLLPNGKKLIRLDYQK